jgi:hypothetical protein
MTSANPRPLSGFTVLLVVLGLVVAAPFILTFLFVGMAMAIALAAKLAKLAMVVLAIWAAVALFKAVFGGPKTQTLTRVATVPRLDPEVELEHARRARQSSMAELDRELAQAIAKKGE